MTAKIAFFGTPELCVPILEALRAAQLTPSLVVTNPDRPVGRKHIFTPPPVKVWAQDHSLPVLQPEKLTRQFREKLMTYHCNLFIVVAYGQILTKKLLTVPTYGTLNIHYSLLPRYRGAAPVEAAILNGDTETGVCIQHMVYKLDAGDILATLTHPINPDITAPELRHELNQRAAKLLVETIPAWLAGTITPQPQNHALATYVNKINKSEAELNLTDPGPTNYNKYRAYFGWPRAHFYTSDGQRIIITQAHRDGDDFVIDRVIPSGKGEVSYQDFLNQTNK